MIRYAKWTRRMDRKMRNVPSLRGTFPRWIINATEDPHTLIAGTTGAGKSVLLHDLITALLCDHPTASRLVLIDTKKTELYRYIDCPHTNIYADTPEDAITALKSVKEAIATRNEMMRSGTSMSTVGDMYVIIDELGDLILNTREATSLLSHIAMVGRSAKVHLIGCTQNPCRKILSAQIEGNCPVHIGLRCTNAIESKQIIGTADAAELPRYGKAYFRSPDYMTPQLIDVPMLDPTPYINYWANAMR